MSSAVGDESFIFAEGGGFDGKDVVGSGRVVPEFLAPFDSVVHFLDQGFHQRARDRESLAAVVRVVHALAIVGQIS